MSSSPHIFIEKNPMHDITDKVKIIGGNILAWTGTVTSWQGQITWFIQVIAGCAAIVVSLLTIRSLLRKEKNKE